MRKVHHIVIPLSGELDIFAQPTLRETLEPALDPGADAVVDMTRVTYLEAATIGELVRVLRAKDGQRRKLALVVASARVERMFTLTGLTQRFAIYGTVAEAIAAFAAPTRRSS